MESTSEASRLADDREPARITVVGIPTRGRRRCLERCLESHLESSRRHGRAVEYAIIDDSPEPESRRSTREMLGALRDRYAADVSYAGPEEKERYVRELARLGLPEPVVRFGLLNREGFPITTGGSRNALLLHAAGELLLQVDDDTLCRMARPPEFRPGLAFSSRHDPTEFWFPGNESVAADADLLALHETLLGRCAAEWTAAPETDLTQARPEFLRKLDRGRVLVTAAGVAGHSGMGSSLYFLSLDGPSRARLLSSVDAYRRALTNHQVVRTATRMTVCDGAYCMALNLGLDNRRPLPPFLPVQRNQDGVFAVVLRVCRDDGLFGFLPAAVVHAPPDQRPLPDDDLWRSAAGLRSGQMLQILIRSLSSPTDLRTAGRTLAEWGSLPPADFEELLRLRVAAAMSKQAAHLDGLLQRHRGRPDFWADDVRRVLAVLRDALVQKEYVVSTDLIACFGTEAARERFQRLVLQYGRLMQMWPDVVAAATELRARGVRPAVRA